MEAVLVDMQLAAISEALYMIACVIAVGSAAGLGFMWWKKSK